MKTFFSCAMLAAFGAAIKIHAPETQALAQIPSDAEFAAVVEEIESELGA